MFSGSTIFEGNSARHGGGVYAQSSSDSFSSSGLSGFSPAPIHFAPPPGAVALD